MATMFNHTALGETERDVIAAYNEVGRALARGASYSEIVEIADAFGAQFLPDYEAHGNRAAARQIRRLVAAAHLNAAIATQQPLDVCEALLSRCFAVGFNDAQALALKIGVWARCCVDQGDPTRAAYYLIPLIEDLEDEHARTGDDAIAQCLKSAQQCLDGLRVTNQEQ